MPPRIFESEYRFCRILWEHEPVRSTELVHLCREQLDWSKATTYTVIRRLTERGVVSSEKAVVRSLVSREEIQAAEIEALMDKTFAGSLPAFLRALSRSEKLCAEEAAVLRRLADARPEE